MSWTHVKLIWFFMRPHRWLFASVLLVSVAASVLESVNLLAFFPVFTALTGTAGPSAGGNVVRAIEALSRWLGFSHPLLMASAVLLVVMVVKVGVTLWRETLIAQASGTALYALTDRLVARYAATPQELLIETRQGEVLNNCLSVPARVSFVLLRACQASAELLKVLAIAAVLFAVWPSATSVLVAAGAGYYWLTRHLARRISYTSGRGRAAAFTEQMHVANEFFRGVRQITVAGAAPAWLARLDRANGEHRTLYVREQTWLSVPVAVMELAVILMFLSAVLAIWVRDPTHLLALLPTLGVFGVASLRLLQALMNMGRQTMEMMGRVPDLAVAHQALSREWPVAPDGRRAFLSLKEGIRMDGVSFAYRGREGMLRDVSLAFKAGAVTAIVGPSGSGKTTLINLLLTMLQPTSGAILVDGVPLADYRRQTWLSKIGFVSQDPFLFHGTVRDNILIGRSGFPPEDVIRASQVANAHEFFMKLPHGYDTMIGERGMKLSGGQQQRLAIARAMLDNPELLVLDEATSHLDTVSEQQVQDAIEQAAKGRTVIVVAHRLSTIKRADWIIVLQDGQAVEEGTHETLLSHPRHYATLVGVAA